MQELVTNFTNDNKATEAEKFVESLLAEVWAVNNFWFIVIKVADLRIDTNFALF